MRRHVLPLIAVLLSTVVLMELALQVIALGARRGLLQADPGGGGGAGVVRILCLGDSHTYGLPLPASESYPAQLERALEERFAPWRFEVINLGIPGLNSSFVANRLERQMMQLRPDLVAIWVGINNRWNVIESGALPDDDVWTVLRRALMPLRLFRYASIAWFSNVGYQYDPEQRGGWFEGELPPSGRLARGHHPRHFARLVADMESMVATARSLDTPILFLGYPLPSQRPLSTTIERTAARLGVAVVHSASARERAERDGYGWEQLVDDTAGPHPSSLLYRYVVDDMAPLVRELLAVRGIVLVPSD